MVRLPLQCLVWGCLLTAVHPEPPCRPEQYQVNGRCCDLCPPGKKLVNDCAENIDTECQSCREGEFLSSLNRARRCHPHKYCDPNLGLKVQKEGTVDTDTTCVCEEGWHCASDACERCIQHRLCHPGFGVQELGTGVSDTVCEPCPIGHFSNVSSALEKCHPWTSCSSKDLVELRAGTNMTDAICGSWPRSRALVAIPITTAVLFAVLFLSVFISKVVKKPPNKVSPHLEVKKYPVEIDFKDNPTTNTTAPVQETLQGCQPVAQEDGKESRISVQERQ
ncbi:PREDICTED: tumor necrosis factor receptor superfamily member 5 [Elephantulus edwardii]|uniref:tumor necrosis factor receptor superfamily member 5 n=1 Tax=Elephantulus edwardii TaxID=28737 RepID=UPI0003F068DD|nr:PREDICTED: tumor necrosis factor receptor superfamily member 5 [Elephantulus edwardii]